MIYSSDTIGKLAEALALAQGEIAGAVKGAVNPHFKSRYADLATVWETWQAVGPKNGLALVQMPGAFADGKVELTTRLLHKSGEWLSETAVIPVSKSDAQGYGSALTYARRYALAAFVGIAPEDDDGEAAVGRQAQTMQRKPERAQAAPAPAEAPEDKKDAAMNQAVRDWCNNAILDARAWVTDEDARAWINTKRNKEAMEKLRTKYPEAAATLEKEIDERRGDIMARMAA